MYYIIHNKMKIKYAEFQILKRLCFLCSWNKNPEISLCLNVMLSIYVYNTCWGQGSLLSILQKPTELHSLLSSWGCCLPLPMDSSPLWGRLCRIWLMSAFLLPWCKSSIECAASGWSLNNALTISGTWAGNQQREAISVCISDRQEKF